MKFTVESDEIFRRMSRKDMNFAFANKENINNFIYHKGRTRDIYAPMHECPVPLTFMSTATVHHIRAVLIGFWWMLKIVAFFIFGRGWKIILNTFFVLRISPYLIKSQMRIVMNRLQCITFRLHSIFGLLVVSSVFVYLPVKSYGSHRRHGCWNFKCTKMNSKWKFWKRSITELCSRFSVTLSFVTLSKNKNEEKNILELNRWFDLASY